jgi:Trypsin-like peptidase domain
MEASRATQIIAERGSDRSFGSGYLVAPGRVLTAAHVLTEATRVLVRVNEGDGHAEQIEAESWWADPNGAERTDLAVINTTDRLGSGMQPTVFGRISDDEDAWLPVQAMGFPRFKYRDDRRFRTRKGDAYRDLEQLSGTAPVQANRRQGTLAINLGDPPPAALGSGQSPWEGMSGAAVWQGHAIIAVIAEHHPWEGTGRLAARRIDRAYRLLPLQDLSRLIELLGLPNNEADLFDATPDPSRQLARSAYLAEVRDLAPAVLIGRDEELDELTEFCAGPDGYAWWTAGPWAGKTALASWFVTHPPRGLEVVAFVGGRLLGHADSTNFIEAMIRQLMALTPFAMLTREAADIRKGTWIRLLEIAAQNIGERGRGLVVVVDGLDEDEAGSVPARGRASIASQLPRDLPRGVHVIVMSRPQPGLPYDVPADHPLRRSVPRQLTVSPAATDQETRAKQEVWDLLNGDQQTVDLLGLITASGGGLTRSDLSALTDRTPHALDTLLLGVFGRSLARQTAAGAGRADGHQEGAYIFAHDTLRALAERELGPAALAAYRGRLHVWAQSVAASGWPEGASRYFITSYPRMLIATGDTARISALARNQRRHAFLQHSTDTDYAVLSEINAALRLLVTDAAPDLEDLAELVVLREIISTRNSLIPVMLPATWERLGHHEHAEALARSILEPEARAQAFAALVAVSVEGGDLDRAQVLARTVTYSKGTASAFDRLIANVAKAGDLDRAQALADGINPDRARPESSSALSAPAPSRRPQADPAGALARSIADPQAEDAVLLALIGSLARAGDVERAEGLLTALGHPSTGTRAVTDLVEVVAASGNVEHAEALARTLDEPERGKMLRRLVPAMARAGDTQSAEALARGLPKGKSLALAELVEVLADQGDIERAETVTATIKGTHRTIALRPLACAVARSGDLPRAVTLANKIASDVDRLKSLVELVKVAAEVGDLDSAEALADTIGDDWLRSSALAALTLQVARTGDLERAEALTTKITADVYLSEALTGIVPLLARTDEIERAEALIPSISDDHYRSSAVAELVQIVAESGDINRAESQARMGTGEARDNALAALVGVVARTDVDRAEALAGDIVDEAERDTALTTLLTTVAGTGDLDRAQRLATAINGDQSRTQAMAALMLTAARTGELLRAEQIAKIIPAPRARALALSGLAIALVEQADFDGARAIAAHTEALARTVAMTTSRPALLSPLIEMLAASGDLDHAEYLVDTITDPLFLGPTLEALVAIIADGGDLERAERLADTISDPHAQARARSTLCVAIAVAGDLDRAQQCLAGHPFPSEALSEIAQVVARTGDIDRAEAIAMTIPIDYYRSNALASLVPEIAAAGHIDRAQALAGSLENVRDQALAALVPVIAQAGDVPRAEALARTLDEAWARDQALAALVPVIAQAGDVPGAEALARTLENVRSGEDAGAQDKAFATLVPVIAQAGDIARAEALAEGLADVGLRFAALRDLPRPAIPGSQATREPGMSAALRRILPALIFTPNWTNEGLSLLRFFPTSALRRACDAAQSFNAPV